LLLPNATPQEFDVNNLLEHSSDPPIEPKAVAAARPACRQCSEFLDVGDNFCRCCGMMTEVGAARVKIGKLAPPAALSSVEAAPKPPNWLESPVTVLLGLFVFFGPLALPLLWRSRRFTRAWKIGLTVVVLLATYALYWYVKESLNNMLEEYKRLGLM
jgi:hypothetical protein